jgi:hypothetical protein
MTFITPASITNANPGPTLYAVIETAALALGFTLDDTVTIGGNTHKVLKSAAAGNTYGLDWYLDINYPTTGTTGGMRFAPFEGYTAASDVGTRGPFGNTVTSTLDATTYSRYGATTNALETNWTNNSSASGVSMPLSTSAFTYWISITRDRIIVLTSVNVSIIYYTGFFTPSSAHSSNAGAALFPLVMAAISTGAQCATGNGSTATMAFTRVPKASTIAWADSGRINSLAPQVHALVEGQVGTAVSEFTGRATIIPLQVQMGSASVPSTSTPLAANVGQISDVATGYVTTAAVRGDTVTVGSDTWYAATASGSATLFMRGV